MANYSWQQLLGSPTKIYKSLNCRRKELLKKISDCDTEEKKNEEKEWIALVAERDKILNEVIAKENQRLLDEEFRKVLQNLKFIGTFNHVATPPNVKIALCGLYRELQLYLKNRPDIASSVSDLETLAQDETDVEELAKENEPEKDGDNFDGSHEKRLCKAESIVSGSVSDIELEQNVDEGDASDFSRLQNDLSKIVQRSSPKKFEKDIVTASKVLNVESIDTSTNVFNSSEDFATSQTISQPLSEVSDHFNDIQHPNVEQIEEVIEKVHIESTHLSPLPYHENVRADPDFSENIPENSSPSVRPRTSTHKESGTGFEYQYPTMQHFGKGPGKCVDVTDAIDLVTVAQREQYTDVTHVYKSLFHAHNTKANLDETRETNYSAEYESDDSVD